MGNKHKTTAQYESMALDAIKKHNLMSVKDIAAFIGISTQTFYNHKLDEFDSLKQATEENRLKTVQSMKQKWFKSDAPALQIGLMKIIGGEEIRKHLTQQRVDHTSKGEALPTPQVYMPADLSDDELELPPAV